MSLTNKVIAHPNGLQTSFAFVVAGLPYFWDDGLANWATVVEEFPSAAGAYIHKPGGLVGKPSGLVQNGNPLEPLTTGNGANFKLKDDGSRYLKKLFAVNNRGGYATRLTADQVSNEAGDEVWGVETTDGLDVGQILYCGLETTLVDEVVDANNVRLFRGCFNSKRSVHIGAHTTTMNAYTGSRLTSSPTIFRGRYVQLLLAYVSEGGVVSSYDCVWQGVLGKIENEGTHVAIVADPLSDNVKKAEWPMQLAKGSVRVGDNITAKMSGSKPNYFLADISFISIDDHSVTGRDSGVPIGQYVDGVYTRLPVTDTELPIAQWYAVIRDTILFALRTMLSNPDGAGWISNRFMITSEIDNGKIKFFYTNKSRIRVHLGAETGIGKWAVIGGDLGMFPDGYYGIGAFFYPDTVGRFIRSWRLRGALLTSEDVEIPVVLDNPNNTFDTLSGYDGEQTLGYVSITQGEEREIVSFTGVSPDIIDPKKVTLTGVRRGRAGTEARTWNSTSETAEPVIVQQIVMLEAGGDITEFSPGQVLNYLLGSTGVGAGIPGYDVLGWKYSPGFSQAQFDHYGVLAATAAVGDMPAIKCFYIDTQGGGAKALEEYLKFCGLYLIAKRYPVDGYDSRDTFGLSVDVIDPPVASKYSLTCTDSDRSAIEAPKTDYNERLLINVFEYVPKLTFMSDKEFAAGADSPYRKWDRLAAINVYADESITDYGMGQNVEIKEPAFLFERANHIEDADTAREAAVVWAVLSASRWFSAFANGNYLLIVKVINPGGWRYQMGDRVLCTFKGVTGPNGDEDLSAVGKVVKVDSRWSDGCVISLRLSYDQDGAELCPGATCLSHTAGNNVQLSSTFWCDPYATDAAAAPFPNASGPTRDWMWFDPVNHGGVSGLQCWIWEAGNINSRVSRKITALSDTGVVTFDSALSAGLQATITAGVTPVYMTFWDYEFTSSNMSPLRKLYAYVADLDNHLGNTDPAKEYV